MTSEITGNVSFFMLGDRYTDVCFVTQIALLYSVFKKF